MRSGVVTSRRGFLAGSLASALLPRAARAASSVPPPRRPVPDSAWRLLAARVTGGVVRPGDADFVALSRPQNLRYEKEVPLAVARPRDASEVAAAITWCRDVGVPLVVRSGGHSYAGCSAGTGLIIHTGLMHGVRQVSEDVFEFEAGALLGEVSRVLADARAGSPGGMTATHGRCPGVGATAFLLGGGIGFAMRDRGIGCDHLMEADVALADSRIVRASATENADLFWALCGGGGGNLGVVLRSRLRAFPAEMVTTFKLLWDRNVETVFQRLVRALEASPERMGAKLSVAATRKGSRDPNAVALLGQLRGPQDEAMAILAPVLTVAEPRTQAVQTTPYWEGQPFLAAPSVPNRYQETSRYCGRLSERFIDVVFRHCRMWPGTKSEGGFSMFHVGGRIRAVPAAATAYVHRDAEWLTGIGLNWTTQDSAASVATNLAWQRQFHAACAALTPGAGSYQNFPDPGLANPAVKYYGGNLPRLVTIKRQVDPDRVFTPPRRQGID